MKYRMLIILVIFLACTHLFSMDKNFYIRGRNQTEYVYKDSTKLNHYLENNLDLVMGYKKVKFGLEFFADLPNYDETSPGEQLSADQIKYDWENLFLTYEGSKVNFTAGKFTESFGEGNIFKSWNDEDNDVDNRLTGIDIGYLNKSLHYRGIYGANESDINEEMNDLFLGSDINYDFNEDLKFGVSAANYQYYQLNNSYAKKDIFSSRIHFSSEKYKNFSEIGILRGRELFDGINSDERIDGHMIYLLNLFNIGFHSIKLEYKNYKNFDYEMNDLPMVSYSEKPLSKDDVGKDEQGLLVELKMQLSPQISSVMNYSEGWDSKDENRQMDAYFKMQKMNENSIITYEFIQYERRLEADKEYERETTSGLIFDFPYISNPSLFKLKYTYEEDTIVDKKKIIHKPYSQFDIEMSGLNLSIFSELEIADGSDFSDVNKSLAFECMKDIGNSTSILFFIGKENGGKVCRNGVCRYRSAFKGIRFKVVTLF